MHSRASGVFCRWTCCLRSACLPAWPTQTGCCRTTSVVMWTATCAPASRAASCRCAAPLACTGVGVQGCVPCLGVRWHMLGLRGLMQLCLCPRKNESTAGTAAPKEPFARGRRGACIGLAVLSWVQEGEGRLARADAGRRQGPAPEGGRCTRTEWSSTPAAAGHCGVRSAQCASKQPRTGAYTHACAQKPPHLPPAHVWCPALWRSVRARRT